MFIQYCILLTVFTMVAAIREKEVDHNSNCSTQIRELLTKDPDQFSPEKVIYSRNGNGGMTAEEFCEKQKNLAAELVFACPKASVVELNWSVAYGILLMMTTLCNPTTNSLKPLYDREQKCESYIKRVTSNCALKSGTTSPRYGIYPSNLRIMVLEMKDRYGRWTLMECIAAVPSEMRKEPACSIEHQNSIQVVIDTLVPRLHRGLTYCRAKINELISKNGKNSSPFSPERVILSGLGGMKAADFCELQTKSAIELTSACPSNQPGMDKMRDRTASLAASGILTMMYSVCDDNKANLLKTLEDRYQKCEMSTGRAAINCVSEAGEIRPFWGFYPSDLMIAAMMDWNYSKWDLCDKHMKPLKDCIASEMRKEDVCSIEQQNAILAVLDPLASVCCGTLSHCPVKFEKLTRNSAFSPEKVIFSGLDAMKVRDFCKLRKMAALELTSVCPLTQLNQEHRGAAFSAFEILKMINTLCDNFPTPRAAEDNGLELGCCERSIKSITTDCLLKSGVKSIESSTAVYPTDLMMMMMMKEAVDYTTICEAKYCIMSQIHRGACPSHLKKALKAPLDMLVSTCHIIIDETTTTNSPNPPKYTGCLATRGPFNLPYNMYMGNLNQPSTCDSDSTCRERHPGNNLAFCRRKDDKINFCCRDTYWEKNYGEIQSECLGDCNNKLYFELYFEDHAHCRRLSPTMKPATCFRGCCRAEYE